MRSADFFSDVEVENPFLSYPEVKQTLNTELLKSLRSGPLPDTSDISAAEGLLDLVQDELTAYGTDSTNELNDNQIALAIRTLEAVAGRLGILLKMPFRNFTAFRTYWVRNDGYGSWQARRDIVNGLLEPCRAELAEFEIHAGPKITEEAISNLRDAAAIREHLVRLQRSAHNDPPLAIGTAKELSRAQPRLSSWRPVSLSMTKMIYLRWSHEHNGRSVSSIFGAAGSRWHRSSETDSWRANERHVWARRAAQPRLRNRPRSEGRASRPPSPACSPCRERGDNLVQHHARYAR